MANKTAFTGGSDGDPPVDVEKYCAGTYVSREMLEKAMTDLELAREIDRLWSLHQSAWKEFRSSFVDPDYAYDRVCEGAESVEAVVREVLDEDG